VPLVQHVSIVANSKLSALGHIADAVVSVSQGMKIIVEVVRRSMYLLRNALALQTCQRRAEDVGRIPRAARAFVLLCGPWQMRVDAGVVAELAATRDFRTSCSEVQPTCVIRHRCDRITKYDLQHNLNQVKMN
jgi:hypothetical protein